MSEIYFENLDDFFGIPNVGKRLFFDSSKKLLYVDGKSVTDIASSKVKQVPSKVVSCKNSPGMNITIPKIAAVPAPILRIKVEKSSSTNTILIVLLILALALLAWQIYRWYKLEKELKDAEKRKAR